MMKGEKCDGLYHLMGNTIINGISLTLMDSCKWGARNNKHLCRVFSFVIVAEKVVMDF